LNHRVMGWPITDDLPVQTATMRHSYLRRKMLRDVETS
jgi:hypothetical protein